MNKYDDDAGILYLHMLLHHGVDADLVLLYVVYDGLCGGVVILL